MDIDRDAPAIAEAETRIAAPPETVWAVIAAPQEWPTWSPDIASVELGGPLQSGTTFRWRSKRARLTSRLEVVDPPRELTWTGTTMGIRAVHTFVLEPAEDGGTAVRSAESWRGPLASLLRGSSRRTLASGLARWLELLKAEAERRARAS